MKTKFATPEQVVKCIAAKAKGRPFTVGDVCTWLGKGYSHTGVANSMGVIFSNGLVTKSIACDVTVYEIQPMAAE